MIQTRNAPAMRSVLERKYAVDTTLSGSMSGHDQRALTAGEINAVLRRCDVTVLTHALDDGSRRSRRAHYALAENALYLAATDCPSSLSCEPRDPAVECDVSELNGLSHWHYVWIHGMASCWRPTGAAEERRVWREGVECLRRRTPELARTEILALENFGLVRVEIQARVGLAITMTDQPRLLRI